MVWGHIAKVEVLASPGRRFVLTVLGASALGWAMPARSGLADWLHGSPPPRPKAPSPEKVATLSRAPGTPADVQVDAFLQALAAAIKARDGESMLPRLSAGYTIEGLPSGFKPADLFVQAIEQTPGPLEIVIRSVAAHSGGRVAQTDCRYPREGVKSVTFRFDADGRLLASDLFKLKRQDRGG
jgi:hypothetical protein